MPTYPYACTACDNRFEVVQAFTDDALTVCSSCQGRLRKVFSSVGVVFKGSGFYRNDSRSSSGADGAASTGDSPAKTGESGGSEPAKTDTPAKGDKPAATGTPATAAASSSPVKSKSKDAVAAKSAKRSDSAA